MIFRQLRIEGFLNRLRFVFQPPEIMTEPSAIGEFDWIEQPEGKNGTRTVMAILGWIEVAHVSARAAGTVPRTANLP